MADLTIEKLATLIGIQTDKLIEQMQSAGLQKSTGQETISNNEKKVLLDYLKKGNQNNTEHKIQLKRKTVRKMQISDGSNKRTINVELRKQKRSYSNNDHQTNLDENKTLPSNEKQEKQNTKRSDTLDHYSNKIVNKNNNTHFNQDSTPVENSSGSQEDKRKGKGKRSNKKDKSYYEEERSNRKLREETRWSETPKKSKRIFEKTTNLHGFNKPTAPVIHQIELPESVAVGDLAQKMAVKVADVIKILFNMGIMTSINSSIDQDTAALVVEEMGHKFTLVNTDTIEEKLLEELTKLNTGNPKPRAPVVTVMGHVDHGKTSLLDYIRKTRVQSSEAGGITQHIGAYHVKTKKGVISFIDTPGHAAFTAMRARGAKVTDLVVLVVAADDGVMPQTEEAIQHAKAGNVPIVVAINKIDKPDADAERIKSELSSKGVISEAWGGDTQFVEVSAHTGQGIDQLLDAILLQAEVLELTAIPKGPAQGIVIESRQDKGRGSVATILVQNGLLKKGDTVLVGKQFGRIRALLNENGQAVKEAGPSIPVEILGLNGTPNAGDKLLVVKDERKAKEVALYRERKSRETKLAKHQAANLENMYAGNTQNEIKLLNIVLKADVRGSLEAIVSALEELGNQEVIVKVISSGVGGITETDANLAMASNAVIIGFNVRADSSARKTIDAEHLDLRYYSIIYDVIDDINKALTGLLGSEIREEILGTAEVRDVFRSPKFGAVAGCMVIEGTIHKNERIRVLRDNVVIYEGSLESLRRFKDDVNEVKHGMECGIAVKNYNDVKIGDRIEVYKAVEIQRTL